MKSWADYWYRWVSAAFLGDISMRRQRRIFCRTPEQMEILLNAFLMEKAVYELGYEMNNRPAWV